MWELISNIKSSIMLFWIWLVSRSQSLPTSKFILRTNSSFYYAFFFSHSASSFTKWPLECQSWVCAKVSLQRGERENRKDWPKEELVWMYTEKCPQDRAQASLSEQNVQMQIDLSEKVEGSKLFWSQKCKVTAACVHACPCPLLAPVVFSFLFP